jgi:hypothetical protein
MLDIGLYNELFADIVIPQTAHVLDVGCFDARSLCYMK